MKSRDKPLPPALQTNDATHHCGSHERKLEQFETVLSPDQCQSRIAGQKGSNACTVIGSLFVEKLLADGALPLSDGFSNLMCASMFEGNQLYDSYHLS